MVAVTHSYIKLPLWSKQVYHTRQSYQSLLLIECDTLQRVMCRGKLIFAGSFQDLSGEGAVNVFFYRQPLRLEHIR